MKRRIDESNPVALVVFKTNGDIVGTLTDLLVGSLRDGASGSIIATVYLAFLSNGQNSFGAGPVIIFSTVVPGATAVTLPLFLYSTLITADGSFKPISVHNVLVTVALTDGIGCGCCFISVREGLTGSGGLTSVVALYAEQTKNEIRTIARNIFTA